MTCILDHPQDAPAAMDKQPLPVLGVIRIEEYIERVAGRRFGLLEKDQCPLVWVFVAKMVFEKWRR